MQMLYRNVERFGHKDALVYGDERYNFCELTQTVERLAGGLRALGIKPGDPVVMVLSNTPAFVISFFAIVGIGAIVVPLNPSFTEEEIAFYVDNCQARALLTEKRTLALCQSISTRRAPPLSVIHTTLGAEGPDSFQQMIHSYAAAPLAARAGQEEALYQFSSGSTGRPKRVSRTQAMCRAEAENFVATAKLNAEDNIFCAIPLFHAHGLGNCLFAALCSGATMVMLEKPQPFILKRNQALHLLEQEKITVFPGIPFLFKQLAESTQSADLTRLRLCFSAGSALPEAIFNQFYERFSVPIRQLYGCTEAGSVTINLDADPRCSFASVGKPIQGTEIAIVDEHGAPLGPGAVGEIIFCSPSLTKGYDGMAALNQLAFRDGAFFTGDVGRIDDEGRLFITGRKKMFIEVAGYKVDPKEIEDLLDAHPAVAESVVVGMPGKIAGEEIIKAVVVAKSACTAEELMTICRHALAEIKWPHIIEFRDEIPKSSVGKVLRQYLL